MYTTVANPIKPAPAKTPRVIPAFCPPLSPEDPPPLSFVGTPPPPPPPVEGGGMTGGGIGTGPCEGAEPGANRNQYGIGEGADAGAMAWSVLAEAKRTRMKRGNA